MRVVLAPLAALLLGCGLVGYDAPPSSIATDANPNAIDADPNASDADPNAADAAPAVCPDDVCTLGETCAACAEDCATAAPVCGNGVCNAGETAASCYDDCGPIDAWPSAWESLEGDLFTLINTQRGAGATCPGMGAMPAAAGLTTNSGLTDIARNHSWDATRHNYDPVSIRCNGQTTLGIMADSGFAGARATLHVIGAASATQAMNFWMNDATSCPIIMSGTYAQIGIGFADDVGQPYFSLSFYQ